MQTGHRREPTQDFREPVWRTVLWVFVIKIGELLGLVVGAVSGFYLCWLIFRGYDSYFEGQIVLWIVSAVIGCAVGNRVGTAIVRRLQGASSLEPFEPSGESGSDDPSSPESVSDR